MTKERDGQRDSAAELLSSWRSAERDTMAAKTAGGVASLALAAAHSAEEAAVETEVAAQAAADAAFRAKEAADRARKAATRAAEAAQLATVAAQGDEARADQAVTKSEHAEGAARDRFHQAEQKGFPK